MSSRNSSPRRMNLSPDVRGRPARPHIPTEDEIRAMFGPARTLGAPEDACIAMDNRLASSGVYTLLQHTFETGMAPAAQFMGYGALQNIAQNGLIRACIETVADDMTRAWIELKREGAGPRTGEDDELLTELAHAADSLELQRIFHEAVELVGYEGGAFIFIDTGVSGDALLTPLHMGAYSAELRPGGILRFVVIDPVNVFPGDYNSLSPLSPDYFRPRWWWVLGQRVHASRLIRLTANEVPVLLKPAYNFLGIPQAQILWDYVLHFQECRAAEARLLTKFSMTVFKTSMADILFSAGGTATLDARMRYMIQTMNNDGVLAVDKEAEDVIKLETPLSGVTDIVRQSLEILAALNRTPAVKLLGISPSGFNATGESDIRNYYDHITSQQEKVLRNGMRTVLDCMQLHLRGEIDPSVTFDFAPLGEEDRAALATMQKTKADTIAVYLDRDIISPEEARKALADDPDSGFADIDPEAVPEGNGMPDEAGAELDDVDKAGAVYDAAFEEGAHPRDRDGKFAKRASGNQAQTPQQKMDSIRIDVERDTTLPNLNPETLAELGRPDKPVLLKKEVVARNALRHADVPLNEAQNLIGEALYNPVHVVRGNSEKDYINFIGVDRKRNCVVLLDVQDAKDNFEIVHWHYVRPRSARRLVEKGGRQ